MHLRLVAIMIVGGFLATCPVLYGTPSKHKNLPELNFTEVLEVISTGVHIEKQHLLERDPSLRDIFRDAEKSLHSILESGTLDPDAVFGKLQNDLGHHHGREFSLFIQSFWDAMALYQDFFRLNADLHDAGVRTPFAAFLGAIHKGLEGNVRSRVMIAGDGGQVNPMNMIRRSELVFTSW